MDYIGGVLNSIGKMPKTYNKKEFCNGFTGASECVKQFECLSVCASLSVQVC